MKKKWIMRSILYVAFAAFSIYILYSISNKVITNRVVDYQKKYINVLYKNINHTKQDYDASFKRFALETIGLQKGSIDFTKPVYEQSVTEVNYASEVTERFYLDIKIYKTRLHQGKKIREGYTIFFPKFIYVKGDKQYDLSFRNDGNGNAFFEKGFSKDAQKLLENFQVTLNLGFDETPYLFKNANQKEKEKFSSPISLYAPLYIDSENLKADEKGEKYSTVNCLSFTFKDKGEENKEPKTILIIQDQATTNNDVTNGRLVGLDLSKARYEFAKDSNPTLFDHKSGNDKISDEAFVKYSKLDMSAALHEFDTKPALIITGVFLLVLVAAYFLFGHRYVMVYVKAKKDAKKLNEKDPGFNIKDAEFSEIKEDNKDNSTETTDNK